MKFLFIVSDFDVGGITASLKNLTSLLIERGHEVELLDLPKYGKLPDGFDGKIKMVELDKRARLWNLSAADIKKAGLFGKIKYSFLGIMKKIMNRSEAWHNYAFKNTRFEGYDAVIGFRQSPVCFYLASRKSVGAKKIGFWHGDVDYMGDLSSWDHYLSKLDSVACVSNAVSEGMKKRYENISDKFVTVYNVINERVIKETTAAKLTDRFVINSTTRITAALKGSNKIAPIAKKLKGDEIEFVWRIVGNGEYADKLNEEIKENGLSDNVELLGAMSVPYGEMRNADLFVQVSDSESYGMTVAEALILGTPVVAGYYPALPEILSDGENGIIAENSVDGIYAAVKNVISDKALYKKLKDGALNYAYTPDVAYDQFMEMMKNA